jgi:hypothetical protein
VVKDMGFSDQTHYIRIRPEERDGVWKIRADAKRKNSEGRFVSVASFEIPPLDDKLKNNVSGWATPVWTRKTTANGRAGQAAPAGATANMDFAEDDEIINL